MSRNITQNVSIPGLVGGLEQAGDHVVPVDLEQLGLGHAEGTEPSGSEDKSLGDRDSRSKRDSGDEGT